MSEVYRYNIKPGEDGYEIAVSLGGEWVHYSDYARLKAEVERLTRKIEVADNHAQCLEMVINAGTANELRLKAEVERLKEGNDCLGQMHDKEMERSAYLCEEVNRTTAWGRGLESDLSHARVEISFLKAEVERLTDAITRGALTPDARPDDNPL